MMAKAEPPLPYEQARDIAAAADWRRRQELAFRPDAPPEILYFLAGDEKVPVRRAVALNPATPAKGNRLLADDDDLDVRMELAAKIGRFGRATGVSDDQARSRAIMAEVILRLADDSERRIRATIATVVKDADDIDPAVIRRLAFDQHLAVAAPVLQYSPLLSDEDLLALIAATPTEGVLAAIARRPSVDARVTAAIVASSNSPAITHLLKNANINLQEDTIDALIDGAAVDQNWQEPLLSSGEMSEAALDRVVEMTVPHVMDHILARPNLPSLTAAAVAKAIEDSLRRSPGERAGNGGAGLSPMPEPAMESLYRSSLDKMHVLRAEGQLDEMALTVSLLTDHTNDLVAGLSILADVSVRTVLEIASAHSARAICALAWAAGLSATFAVDLQMRLGNIPLSDVLKPGPNDSYGLSGDEMTWQLDMFSSSLADKGGGL
ncbi:MAG TPA: DUF2336 domain-containing protein [Telmatospirillum sp.]|nr:DUF2336 domain-containing protein [Telmatospirillum sp.]